MLTPNLWYAGQAIATNRGISTIIVTDTVTNVGPPPVFLTTNKVLLPGPGVWEFGFGSVRNLPETLLNLISASPLFLLGTPQMNFPFPSGVANPADGAVKQSMQNSFKVEIYRRKGYQCYVCYPVPN